MMSIIAQNSTKLLNNVFLNKKHQPPTNPQLERYEITSRTMNSKKLIFDQMKKIYVDAFFPMIIDHVYKNDPRLKKFENILNESKFSIRKIVADRINKMVAGRIIDSLKSCWDKEISQLSDELKNGSICKAYLTIAKNGKENVGFVIFKKRSVHQMIRSGNLDSAEKSILQRSLPSNEILVGPLAVAPGTQKKGIGKALLFEPFHCCQGANTIFLTTSASNSNTNTQNFYKHVGFTEVLKGQFCKDPDESGYREQEILFKYTKS